jgi:translation initiation factor eIF-2B subunit delta
VYSRAGTALVAMMCKKKEVPVVVCAETYKFAEGVGLDGFTKNELGTHSHFRQVMPFADIYF